MIDSKILAEDLEPELWSRLQEILNLLMPSVHILHILISNDSLCAVSWDKKLVEIPMKALDTEEELWKYAGDAHEIRIYTQEGLEEYDKRIQSPQVFQMDTDDYMDYLYRELDNIQGIKRYKRHKGNPTIFTLLRQWLREDGIYLFWLNKEETLYFNCIFQIKEGKLVLLTTSGRYPQVWKNFEKVCHCLEEEFCSPVHRVIMDYQELKGKC